MDEKLPNLKDTAEFFRLALRAGVCDVATVVHWSDGVVMSEAPVPFAFYDLSTSDTQPWSVVTSLLAEIPGDPTPELAVFMLLGHCHAQVGFGNASAEALLVRLYKMAVPAQFSETIYNALLKMEDRFWLAHDGVYGIVEEVMAEFVGYLSRYTPYAPNLPS